ncbi:hypothetical protein ERW21_07130 [Shigella sonnei]|nr:hypothetical protein [Shigella sonnei]EFB1490487.1 hypothetical protein [Escherichia coli]EFW1013937.1 hypothetical protein [Shigella flexneri]EAB0571296.1 hypothetical protein [Shigella sonnei]EAB0575735.1 hypothetical protein [Shigella sonnei]
MHFAQRVRALVVLNGVALLPQFACKQGLANGGNWCACSHRGAAYPDRCMLYLRGERGCPPLRDILWMS